MAELKERILADAQSRRPQYAERMSVLETTRAQLPKEIKIFTIRIDRLHDYLPMNYLSYGDELYCSLQKGDFERAVRSLRVVEGDFRPAAFVALFQLLELPSSDHFHVENAKDIAISQQTSERVRQQLPSLIKPASVSRENGRLEYEFFLFNTRTRGVEKYNIRIFPDYRMEGGGSEVLNIEYD